MNIIFTARECRFVFDLIRHRPIQEMGKLATELLDKVSDSLTDMDSVSISISTADLKRVYLMINGEQGHVSRIRDEMQDRLMLQFATVLSEAPVMTTIEVDDPEFIPDPALPDQEVPKIEQTVPTFSDTFYEWYGASQEIANIQRELDDKLNGCIISGKNHMQSLRG